MPLFAVGMVVIGLGMGPTSLSYILAVQHAVAWGRRGAATGAVIFFRTMGGSLWRGRPRRIARLRPRAAAWPPRPAPASTSPRRYAPRRTSS